MDLEYVQFFRLTRKLNADGTEMNAFDAPNFMPYDSARFPELPIPLWSPCEVKFSENESMTMRGVDFLAWLRSLRAEFFGIKYAEEWKNMVSTIHSCVPNVSASNGGKPPLAPCSPAAAAASWLASTACVSVTGG